MKYNYKNVTHAHLAHLIIRVSEQSRNPALHAMCKEYFDILEMTIKAHGAEKGMALELPIAAWPEGPISAYMDRFCTLVIEDPDVRVYSEDDLWREAEECNCPECAALPPLPKIAPVARENETVVFSAEGVAIAAFTMKGNNDVN